jgi:hypothetical protein
VRATSEVACLILTEASTYALRLERLERGAKPARR